MLRLNTERISSEYAVEDVKVGESLSFKIKSFQDWLFEEGELNTSDQIAQKDFPLGEKKLKKRKKVAKSEEEEKTESEQS